MARRGREGVRADVEEGAPAWRGGNRDRQAGEWGNAVRRRAPVERARRITKTVMRARACVREAQYAPVAAQLALLLLPVGRLKR